MNVTPFFNIELLHPFLTIVSALTIIKLLNAKHSWAVSLLWERIFRCPVQPTQAYLVRWASRSARAYWTNIGMGFAIAAVVYSFATLVLAVAVGWLVVVTVKTVAPPSILQSLSFLYEDFCFGTAAINLVIISTIWAGHDTILIFGVEQRRNIKGFVERKRHLFAKRKDSHGNIAMDA